VDHVTFHTRLLGSNLNAIFVLHICSVTSSIYVKMKHMLLKWQFLITLTKVLLLIKLHL